MVSSLLPLYSGLHDIKNHTALLAVFHSRLRQCMLRLDSLVWGHSSGTRHERLEVTVQRFPAMWCLDLGTHAVQMAIHTSLIHTSLKFHMSFRTCGEPGHDIDVTSAQFTQPKRGDVAVAKYCFSYFCFCDKCVILWFMKCKRV